MTHSSDVTTFHCIVFSSYGRRHAGQRPFMLFLMLLKQNWQTFRGEGVLVSGFLAGGHQRCCRTW
jgi:hypothetical protein